MIGHNFRLGEIESAIGIEQLKKMHGLVDRRRELSERLTKNISGLTGLRPPIIRAGCTHSYYMYPMVLDTKLLGVPRAVLFDALVAEGVQGLSCGYVNVHLLPMYQQKMAYGSNGFPWSSEICKREVDYSKGICPVAENLHDATYLGYAICLHDLSDDDVDLIGGAFRKVWGKLDELVR
jgi:dTDP-4-amino-4,6-dideoxygalactose transaminase